MNDSKNLKSSENSGSSKDLKSEASKNPVEKDSKNSAVSADTEKTAKDFVSKDSSNSKASAVKTPAEVQTGLIQQKDSHEKNSLTDRSQEESQETSAKKTKQEAEKKEEQTIEQKAEQKKEKSIKLNSLFAFKVGMTNVYEKNQRVPVTVLRYKTACVTQIKTKEKEGYTAVQTALESSKKASKALQGHLKKAGFKNKAVYIREVSGPLPEGVQEGQKISIESLQKGDQVFVSGISKGHGFSGVVKRWGFGGGPASHGAEKHRTTGSIANTATQGRVFPGKKMPGHFGCDRITQKSRIVDVLPDQSAILVQGPVPGSTNSLIEIRKQEALK